MNVKEIRFDLFLNAAPPTIVLQPDAPRFTIITANKAYLNSTHYRLEDLEGKSFTEIFPENELRTDLHSRQTLHKSVCDAVESKMRTVMKSHRYDIWVPEKNGSEPRYWSLTNSPIVNEQGIVECIVHTAEDITEVYELAKKERIAVEVAEVQRRQLYESFAQAPVGIGLLAGPDLMIEFGNDTMLAFLGVRSDVIGKNCEEAFPELLAFVEILKNVYTTGEAFYGENVPAAFHKNGVLYEGYFDFIYHPLKNDEGITTGIMIVSIDVTDKVESLNALEKNISQKTAVEQALRHNEARLQSILDTMAEGVVILNADGKISYTNDSAKRIVGFTDEQVQNRSYNDNSWKNCYLDGTLLPKENFPLYVALRTQQPVYDYEHGIISPNGRIVYISLNAAPVFDGENRVIGSVGTFTDVTNRRKLINQLAESESRFRGIFEQAPLGMCLLRGREQVIEAVNDDILKMWGRTREEVIGQRHHQARPELIGQGAFEKLDEVFTSGITRTNVDMKLNLFDKTRGGMREAIVNSIYQPITNANGAVIGVLVITDEVTEEYYARQQAIHNQEMFSLAVESAALGTWHYNVATKEFMASPRLKELFGYLPEERMNYAAAVKQIDEEYRESVLFVVREAYHSKQSYEAEFPVVGFNDQQLRWVRSTGKMYPANDGKGAQFSGTLLDITERKLDDIRKNDFIAMVSHELKTPLTSMKAYLQIAQLQNNISNNPFATLIGKADQQINRMTSLINNFLNVSRLDAGKIHLDKSHFSIDKLINEMADEMSVIVTEHVLTINECHSVMVYADYEKIGQVINNFLSNAVKYSNRGSHITVNCSKRENHVQISVQDEGRGISDHDKKHLFDRYYRVETKDNTRISGFGIGLYLCAEIVQRHSGKIWVESEEGKGSTFYFDIPLE